jgi:hypothetical protein
VETKVKIVPEHVETGFKIEYLCLGDWIDYGGALARTEYQADSWIRKTCMRSENCGREKFRIVPASEVVPAWPSRDYIEARWLDGFQGARRGEGNPYAEPEAGEAACDNYVLWEEGAAAFRAGQNIFA